MFRSATHSDIEDIAGFSWGIQSNIETSSYPIDRYKSKEDMVKVMTRYISGNPKYPEDTVLVLRKEGVVHAAAILDVDVKNRYLQTCGIYAAKNLPFVYGSLTAWCAERYKGFELVIGLPRENKAARDSILGIGGSVWEDSDFLRLDSKDFTPFQSDSDVGLLNLRDFDEFAILNDKYNPPNTTYWNSELIRENLDTWRIYILYNENKIAGCVKYMAGGNNNEMSEIYGFALSEQCAPTAYCSLLSKSAAAEFANGKRYILCSVETTEKDEREAALLNGFKQVGSYVCYRVNI